MYKDIYVCMYMPKCFTKVKGEKTFQQHFVALRNKYKINFTLPSCETNFAVIGRYL